jgi:hypothetical protein
MDKNMKNIKNKRIRNWAIIILLIINISALSSFIIAKISADKNTYYYDDPECEVERILAEQIGFDQDQLQEYVQLKSNYDRDVHALRTNMQETMADMLEEVGKKTPDTSIINKQAEVFGRQQAELKARTMQHLINLRQMSRNGQEARFDELFTQLQHRHRRGMGRGMGQGMGRGRGMGYGQQNRPCWQNQPAQTDTSGWEKF